MKARIILAGLAAAIIAASSSKAATLLGPETFESGLNGWVVTTGTSDALRYTGGTLAITWLVHALGETPLLPLLS
jgi:hypothetical protein